MRSPITKQDSKDSSSSRPSQDPRSKRRLSVVQNRTSIGSDLETEDLVFQQQKNGILDSIKRELLKTFTMEKLEVRDKEISWIVLLPDCRFRLVWECLGLIFLIFELISIPYRLSFNSPAEGKFKALEDISAVFFLLDILLHFSTGFYHDGVLVVAPKRIIRRYLQKWFWIDFLVSFPWLWIANESNGDSTLNTFTRMGRMTRLLRIIKLTHVLSRLEVFAEVVHWGYFVVALGRVILSMILLSHFSACLWYSAGVSGLPASCKDEPWMCEEEGEYWAWFLTIDWTDPSWQGNDNRLLLYLHSIYFAMATMTTVGYGDIHPISQNEKQFAVGMFLVAIVAFSACIGSIAEIVKTVGMSQGIYRVQMKDLARYMRWRELPYQLQLRLRRYLHYRWEHESELGAKEQAILGQLSPQLRKQVCYCLYGRTVRKTPFLKWLAKHRVPFETMLTQCSSSFRAPGEMLFFARQMDTTIYIVTEGSLAIIQSEERKDCASESDEGVFLSRRMTAMIEAKVDTAVSNSVNEAGYLDYLRNMPNVQVMEGPVYIGESNILMLDLIPRPGHQSFKSTWASPWISQAAWGRDEKERNSNSSSQEHQDTTSHVFRGMDHTPIDLSCPRDYTAVCLEHCQLTTIDMAHIAEILKDYPFVWKDYDEFKKERKREILLESVKVKSPISSTTDLCASENSSESKSDDDKETPRSASKQSGKQPETSRERIVERKLKGGTYVSSEFKKQKLSALCDDVINCPRSVQNRALGRSNTLGSQRIRRASAGSAPGAVDDEAGFRKQPSNGSQQGVGKVLSGNSNQEGTQSSQQRAVEKELLDNANKIAEAAKEMLRTKAEMQRQCSEILSLKVSLQQHENRQEQSMCPATTKEQSISEEMKALKADLRQQVDSVLAGFRAIKANVEKEELDSTGGDADAGEGMRQRMGTISAKDVLTMQNELKTFMCNELRVVEASRSEDAAKFTREMQGVKTLLEELRSTGSGGQVEHASGKEKEAMGQKVQDLRNCQDEIKVVVASELRASEDRLRADISKMMQSNAELGEKPTSDEDSAGIQTLPGSEFEKISEKIEKSLEKECKEQFMKLNGTINRLRDPIEELQGTLTELDGNFKRLEPGLEELKGKVAELDGNFKRFPIEELRSSVADKQPQFQLMTLKQDLCEAFQVEVKKEVQSSLIPVQTLAQEMSERHGAIHALVFDDLHALLKDLQKSNEELLIAVSGEQLRATMQEEFQQFAKKDLRNSIEHIAFGRKPLAVLKIALSEAIKAELPSVGKAINVHAPSNEGLISAFSEALKTDLPDIKVSLSQLHCSFKDLHIIQQHKSTDLAHEGSKEKMHEMDSLMRDLRQVLAVQRSSTEDFLCESTEKLNVLTSLIADLKRAHRQSSKQKSGQKDQSDEPACHAQDKTHETDDIRKDSPFAVEKPHVVNVSVSSRDPPSQSSPSLGSSSRADNVMATEPFLSLGYRPPQDLPPERIRTPQDLPPERTSDSAHQVCNQESMIHPATMWPTMMPGLPGMTGHGSSSSIPTVNTNDSSMGLYGNSVMMYSQPVDGTGAHSNFVTHQPFRHTIPETSQLSQPQQLPHGSINSPYSTGGFLPPQWHGQ